MYQFDWFKAPDHVCRKRMTYTADSLRFSAASSGLYEGKSCSWEDLRRGTGFSTFERLGTCACERLIFPLHVLLIQKADYFRQQMLPYVPDELQGVAALAASHASMVSVMGWDFYSLSYQSAFQALGEGSTSLCLSVGRNCKRRENPTQPPCSG